MTLTEVLYSYTVNDLKQRRVHLPNGSSLNRKADLVAAISGHLLSDALATTVAQLTDLERNAVAEAVHNRQEKTMKKPRAMPAAPSARFAPSLGRCCCWPADWRRSTAANLL